MIFVYLYHDSSINHSHIIIFCSPIAVTDISPPPLLLNKAASWMIPFLKILGVEDGNGLSPFAVSIETPAELAGLVRGFFRPHKKDTRGLTTSKNIPSKNREEDEGSDDKSVEAEEQCHARSIIVTDDDDVPLSARVIATHVREIDLAAKKAAEEEEDSDIDADFISGETDDVDGAEL